MRVSSTVESLSDYGGMEPDLMPNKTVADQFLANQQETFILLFCMYH